MHLAIDETSGTATVTLAGDLTIANAAELRDMLVKALAEADRVAVCLGQVEDMDLSCLQLMCSAHRTALRQGKDFVFLDRRPEAFTRIADKAGFLRCRSCTLNPGEDCLWLGGKNNG